MVGRIPAWLSTVLAGLLLVAAHGCTGGGGPGHGPTGGPTGPTAGIRTVGPDVIDFAGLRGIRFGDRLADLSARGVITTAQASCGSGFALSGIDAASPVFDQDQLVLIWAYPPVHTPENVMVGTPLEQARRAYPTAAALTAPSGSTTYPGLLVAGAGDRAVLLLHDGSTVQKLVVGFERYARRLYDTGFGSC